MSGIYQSVSLHGPERPAHEAVKVKLDSVEDSKMLEMTVMGFLPRRAANRLWKQDQEREVY